MGRFKGLPAAILLAALIGASGPANSAAATSDKVVIARSGARCADDPNCFNRLHPRIPTVARARPGQLIVFEARDTIDSDFDLSTELPRDAAKLNPNIVHPLSGPVYIEGARRGDVLAVTIIDVAPDDYGFTTTTPTGLLADLFPGRSLIANWTLTRQAATSAQIPGVRIPYAAFPGVVTVLPGEAEVKAWRNRESALAAAGGVAALPEPRGAVPAVLCGPGGTHADECLRTISPRENGGNMDIKHLQVGVTILLPCYLDGCGLAVGDVHYAQGDGEVSGTALEMAATVSVRAEIRHGQGAFIKTPHYEGGRQLADLAPKRFYATTGLPFKAAGEMPKHMAYLDSPKVLPLESLSGDLTLAARNALMEMIDYMVREHGLSRRQAYQVASIAVDLHVAQMVDGGTFGATAILPLDIFD